MWVRLTDWQWRAAKRAIASDVDIFTILVDHCTDQGKELRGSRWCVEGPYVAWKETRDRLYADSFGPRGGRARRSPASKFGALQRIERELNYINTHPAMRKMAMFGLHTDIFPVWKTPSGYSSYPQLNKEFVILTPRHQMRGSHQVELTWWVEKSTGEGWLADEALHARLWRRPIR